MECGHGNPAEDRGMNKFMGAAREGQCKLVGWSRGALTAKDQTHTAPARVLRTKATGWITLVFYLVAFFLFMGFVGWPMVFHAIDRTMALQGER